MGSIWIERERERAECERRFRRQERETFLLGVALGAALALAVSYVGLMVMGGL